ncbi:RabGAP/TBC protein [Coccomyxa subellipsoidea C-169]|uniref:RabGAP/TBC protein n=1 Tax=Coccomyxa subellipsoidea (strain C-169) TaxID=574566 RepID=I0Z5T0_COCSC|nr:RabGAP/TBC protein [Coccomyxa subellipsoidea C-169]EIE25999.1 RabGAP/TBC protein [Coccomyxa subellipsoidea C-169]|eukprot:XP_005650543.1 RabGAP/TBC protein [Coccomyxa subellipsoidea C-169]
MAEASSTSSGGVVDDPLSLKQLSLSTSPANIVNHGSQITNDGLREPGGSEGVSGDSPSHRNRLRRFTDVLGTKKIDLRQLRRLAFHGIPDKDGMRATAWKLLLGYLPPDRGEWESVLRQKRAAYQQFREELIIDPKKQEGCTGGDHPLSQSIDSKWNAFFKDAEMMEQIDRDVMRTHPGLHFFSGDDGAAVTHREEMKRVLFIFAKLNPGLRYVQGMNELLAPLYFHFRCDCDRDAALHAEADAFFCFMDIISEFRDNFCQQLDNSEVGIRAMLSRLSSLLNQVDPELWYHLTHKNKVNPQFYAFRWITLLLTQEFSFPDAVRLWDTLFSDPGGRTDCLLRTCVAMLVNVRGELLQGDFSANLKLLQRYPPVDAHAILHIAEQLADSNSIS